MSKVNIMKTGFSELLLEFVDADEIEHGDCKDFQITCPACREAVFKVGTAGDARRYLSHYRGTASDVEQCELRVASISRSMMDKANSEARGQLLADFQGYFLEKTLEAITPSDGPGQTIRSDIRRILAGATVRQSFRGLVRLMRPSLAAALESDEHRKAFFGDGYGYRAGVDRNGDSTGKGQSEYWIARQLAYAQSYSHHLLAPGSLRTLYDATAIGLHKMRRTIRNIGTVGDNEDFADEATQILLYGSDGNLASFLNHCRRNLITHNGRTAPAIALVGGIVEQAVRSALIEFPYVQAAMDAAGKRVDTDVIPVAAIDRAA